MSGKKLVLLLFVCAAIELADNRLYTKRKHEIYKAVRTKRSAQKPSEVYPSNPFFNRSAYAAPQHKPSSYSTSVLSTDEDFRKEVGFQDHSPSSEEGSEPVHGNRRPKQAASIEIVSKAAFDECGVSNKGTPLLLHGEDVDKGEYPWMGALFKQERTWRKFQCGSTLISKRHLVTAAHCIVTSDGRTLNPGQIVAVLGRFNIQDWSSEDNAWIGQPEALIPHPDYHYLIADADIGVVVLPDDLPLSILIRPACLWTGNADQEYIVGKEGTVVGWGVDEDDHFGKVPKQLSIPVVDEDTCLFSHLGFAEITSERTFCAGRRDNAGPCHGDSGSGFMMERNGRWTLRGVVSMSVLEPKVRTCNLKEFVVYTDAAQFVDWIRKQCGC